jgi:pyruvate,water dikinase
MLTHAAIAAREYGIPAVVGTWNATTSVRNGDIVRVNGATGAVEILNRA